jgi:hypothetical protein
MTFWSRLFGKKPSPLDGGPRVPTPAEIVKMLDQEILERVTDDQIPQIVEGLAHDNAKHRKACAAALHRLGPRSVDPLLAALERKFSGPLLKIGAATVLGLLKEKQAAYSVVVALNRSHPAVVKVVLADMGYNASEIKGLTS